jgi:hypothetical protein
MRSLISPLVLQDRGDRSSDKFEKISEKQMEKEN